jgi:hypothetical protein
VISATCSEQKLLTGRVTGSRAQRVDKDVGPLLGENQSILNGLSDKFFGFGVPLVDHISVLGCQLRRVALCHT